MNGRVAAVKNSNKKARVKNSGFFIGLAFSEPMRIRGKR